MSTKKEDFKCNVEKLACGNDKLQLLDELMKLKNSDGFNLLEILTALTAYDDPKFKNQRDEILTHNCANVLKAELLIYDFGEYYNYNENNKSIEEALTLLESDRFKVKTVLNVSSDSDSLHCYKKNTVFENLKNIINKKNISINKLCRITHLNDSHLGKIINGKTKNPGIDYLLAIAEALELTNDEFAELCGYKNDN